MEKEWFQPEKLSDIIERNRAKKMKAYRKEVKQSCLEKIEACLTPKTNFTVGFDAMRKFYGPYKDAVKADAELMDSLADRYCRQQMCSGVRTPEGKRDLYRNGTKDEFIRPSKTRDIGGVTRVRDDLRDAAEATSQQGEQHQQVRQEAFKRGGGRRADDAPHGRRDGRCDVKEIWRWTS